jgi:hypothetical protein
MVVGLTDAPARRIRDMLRRLRLHRGAHTVGSGRVRHSSGERHGRVRQATHHGVQLRMGAGPRDRARPHNQATLLRECTGTEAQSAAGGIPPAVAIPLPQFKNVN